MPKDMSYDANKFDRNGQTDEGAKKAEAYPMGMGKDRQPESNQETDCGHKSGYKRSSTPR